MERIFRTSRYGSLHGKFIFNVYTFCYRVRLMVKSEKELSVMGRLLTLLGRIEDKGLQREIEAYGNCIKRAHTGKRYLIVFLVSVYSEVVAMMRLELYQEAVRM